jgi:hypothetical protein
MVHISQDSSALEASIRYLPLFTDKPLLDACLNYLYAHLSSSTMAKAFLLQPEMPSTLRLMVSLLVAEQVEETVSLEVGDVVNTAPALTPSMRDHELTREELDALLEKPEPQRCYEWYSPSAFLASESLTVPPFQDEDDVCCKSRRRIDTGRLLEPLQGCFYCPSGSPPSSCGFGRHQECHRRIRSSPSNGSTRSTSTIRG